KRSATAEAGHRERADGDDAGGARDGEVHPNDSLRSRKRNRNCGSFKAGLRSDCRGGGFVRGGHGGFHFLAELTFVQRAVGVCEDDRGGGASLSKYERRQQRGFPSTGVAG